ncbi:hypothetical protein [Ferruginibacter sp.]
MVIMFMVAACWFFSQMPAVA